MRRKHISYRMRFKIFARDKFTCQYCGKHAHEEPLEIDHVIPLSHGGTNELDNLITSCRRCNRKKHDSTWKTKIQLLDEEKPLIYEWGGNHRLQMPNTPETRKLFEQIVFRSMGSTVSAGV